MRKLPIHTYGINASQLVLGCMGFGGGWNKEAVTKEHVNQTRAAVEVALENGINMFDHADIYTMGKAEIAFGQVLKETPSLRDDMIIQSKVGIRFADEELNLPGRYDFSKSYITESVDGILSRLGVEYLDTLLLHRPDALMEPGEVAKAFHALKSAGKVRHFGVSNMSEGQIRLLESETNEKLIINQLEMSLHKIGWLESGVHVNQLAAQDNVFPDGTLEFCQLEKIQIQAWGPLAKGLFSGAKNIDAEPDNIKQTAQFVAELAEEKRVSTEAIVLAWLMKHPANIQPVIGTTNPDRIKASTEALGVELTREEWYRLYVASRGVRLP